MILHGNKKKVLKEVIKYYVETTDKEYDDFILEVQNAKNKRPEDVTYTEWLSAQCYTLINNHGITWEDCIENKDVVRSAIKEEEMRLGGEFFTPAVWSTEGRRYLEELLGDQWGEAYVWDASCGTGNLMRGSNYPKDKLFMSSLLQEDIDIIKATPEYEGIEAFQCDFVNDIDWDEHNMLFSDKLPPRLVEVFKQNKPIVFYMNPPYKVSESNSSDVGSYMASNGLAKCALDIFHQFMYRLIMLKQRYKLTNVYLGIFGPTTMFHSHMLTPLYDQFKAEFKFNDGMVFDAGDFSNTSESVGWVVGYTTWRTKIAGEVDKSLVLEAKAADQNNNITTIGKRLITKVDENLHDWAKPNELLNYTDMLPMITSFHAFTGRLERGRKDALGYLMSSNFAIRACRKACVFALPAPDSIPITKENFWRCVASFGARRSYTLKSNPFNNTQYCSKPDTTVEGYEQWVIDSLMVFLFDYSARHAAYRDVEVAGASWTTSNPMFPIPFETVKQVVTDETLLRDMQLNPPKNEYILEVLEQVKPRLSPVARELYDVCIEIMLKTLEGTTRKDLDYKHWTNAWDAGMTQIRNVDGLIPKELDDRYDYLQAKLRDNLYEGVYKYGFMLDTAYEVEDTDDSESEDL